MNRSLIRHLSLVIFYCITGESLTKKAPLMETRCGMSTATSCHQYKELGIFGLLCKELSSGRLCDQICNRAKCKLSCVSDVDCKQQCIAGRCKGMKCKSKKCNQKCLRGACDMDCKGDECFQNCDFAGCTMKCPAGVNICIQKCNRGMCHMFCPSGVKVCKQHCLFSKCFTTCKAHECKRLCHGGECVDVSAPRKTEKVRGIDTKCSYRKSSNSCFQQCVGKDCNLAAVQYKSSYLKQVCSGENCRLQCRNPFQCQQICAGGKCKSMACTSYFCIQECVAGDCRMKCNAKECHQICRGGNCQMSCGRSVQKCYQTCTGGRCKIECNAVKCIPFCWGGGCSYIEHFLYMGRYVRRLRCYFETKDCIQACIPRRVCAVTDFKIFHSMNQTCKVGYCNMHCHTENFCKQTCTRGECKQMRCTTNNCVQVCRGSNCEMECNAKNCMQYCEKGGCKMTCTTNSQSCTQVCNPVLEDCQYGCFARFCLMVLGEEQSPAAG